jgi:serine/threonine protein kinase
LAAAFPQLEILELIGQGGMGFVYQARQSKIERLVALKILPQSLAADPAFAERFTRVARMLARLNHPNIVTLHDFGQAGGFFYLLMEYVDGVNLRQAMKVGRFTPAQALAIVPKICEALQFAHNEGILHRDIKPENILLDSKGRVKIADFGIAKLVGADMPPLGVPPSGSSDRPKLGLLATHVALTETGKVLGTPQYMAPEQLEHPQDVDQRADIYSLGVVFYEMLTGELPLGRFAPPSEKSAVDARVDVVVFRTLQKEREHRTQSAAEVRTQVETIAATPAPAGSRHGEVRTAFAKPSAEWGKRMPLLSPLHSPEVRNICAHLTKAESNRVALLGFLIGVWVVAAVFGIPFLIKSFPSPGNWIVGSVLGIIFFVTLPMLSGIGRQFLCSTAWAKEQGFTPEHLNLFSLRGNNLWKGLGILLVLLSLVVVQQKAITRYLGLSKLTQPIPAREGQQDQPTVQPAATFGPVIEIELAFRMAIDFDTGKLALLDGVKREHVPGGYFPFGPMREKGLDVWCVDLTRLAPAEMRVRRLTKESWDKTTPEQLVQEVHSISTYEPPLSSIGVPTNGPTTYGFQTREGAVGLLQVLGYAEDPRGVKIRYKLIQKANSQTGKTVALTGAANELSDATNNLQFEEIQTTGDTLAGMSQFRWSLPDSFSPEDSEAAITQLRQNKIARPITLVPGQSVELFSVTNKVGGIVRGLLRFERFVPGASSGASAAGTNIQATVQIDSGNSEWLAFYIAAVPTGYRLELGEGDTSTSISGSAGNGQPVVYGQPRQVFSFTSKAGEVYRGLFELVGPPVPANQ